MNFTGEQNMTTSIKRAALTAVAGLMLSAWAATAHAAKPNCVKAGGTATSPTEGIARFMAEAALKNSIEAQGRKAAGPAVIKCDGNVIGATCVANAKACK